MHPDAKLALAYSNRQNSKRAQRYVRCDSQKHAASFRMPHGDIDDEQAITCHGYNRNLLINAPAVVLDAILAISDSEKRVGVPYCCPFC